jgi:heterodisulfide reductase subunit C
MTQNDGKIRDICKEVKDKIEEEDVGKFRKCTVCGKCAGSCSPEIRAGMDLAPWRIIYLLALKDEDMEQVLESTTIQLCVNCSNCVSRCPMKINMPKIMEILRNVVMKHKGDFLNINEIDKDVLEKMPQIGIIEICKKLNR